MKFSITPNLTTLLLDSEMFGLAKGRNVIVLHLESFQQFLINMKVDGQEVTPF